MTFTVKIIGMKFRYVLSILLFSTIVNSNLFAQQNLIIGNWSGKIKLPVGELEMIFKISDSDSGLVSTLDVPAQGTRGLDIKETVFSKDSLTLRIPMILGTYILNFQKEELCLQNHPIFG